MASRTAVPSAEMRKSVVGFFNHRGGTFERASEGKGDECMRTVVEKTWFSADSDKARNSWSSRFGQEDSAATSVGQTSEVN